MPDVLSVSGNVWPSRKLKRSAAVCCALQVLGSERVALFGSTGKSHSKSTAVCRRGVLRSFQQAHLLLKGAILLRAKDGCDFRQTKHPPAVLKLGKKERSTLLEALAHEEQ